ncbi:hypothetical protein FB45DRAFT_40568 [Roridomyces roridus]|uniref:Zn(2)-C6 fungal-type domain-containing protein n=1 Tax=Roridomyces roridus TaxID=1738132 RepID=A0AAD7FJZ4_9AGAR|nr:hypothetical protein FB45DRAFT_40568 [Roridomyces roridus]
MASPHPEKSKKVSRACNTCRLKRKKCDGLDPCIFCTETKLECSYSREPRRRGPPSGYLKHTETRVALLETLLGLFIQSSPQSAHALNETIQTLTEQSKTQTQDVWDTYKRTWSESDAARGLHQLAISFAPFAPTENQIPASKPLLPFGRPQQQQSILRSPSPSPAPSAFPYTNESFERGTPIVSNVPPLTFVPPTVPDNSRYFEVQADLPAPTAFLPSPPADPISTSVAAPSATVYPGAYWRTAALASSPSPTFAALPLPPSPATAVMGLSSYLTASRAPTPTPADLPPSHIRAALVATYRAAVHPSLPILSPAQIASLESATAADPSPTVNMSPMLLLALCAYTARLAPPAASPTRVAADLWYESASALLSSALRRATIRVDAIQTLLFLGLRDHGRGRDALAWRGIGSAVRLAVELGLDGSAEDTHDKEDSERDVAWEKSLWGVAIMMDLFLSIQLGRAPASAEALKPLGTSPSASPSPSVASATVPHVMASAETPIQEGDEDADAVLFTHTKSLVRIVARVHFWVGLDYGSASGAAESSNTHEEATHGQLSSELAAWHRALPQRFRVALGGERVPRSVLEMHMLYQVGVVMLKCGRTVNGGSGSVPLTPTPPRMNGSSAYPHETTVGDAASTFNVLLDKYRPSLPFASPIVVFLVFAAARASSAGSSRGPGASMGKARALQSQLHMLNCREALTGMGGTWELARRFVRVLERFDSVDEEGGASGGSGKRKRDSDGDDPREAKRRGMELDVYTSEQQNALWSALGADSDVATWEADLQPWLGDAGMDVGFGDGGIWGGYGMWDNGHGLWAALDAPGSTMALFDAPPGG